MKRKNSFALFTKDVKEGVPRTMNQTIPPDTSMARLLPDTSENEFGRLMWLNWWYQLSLPQKPAESAPFQKRDTYRRARFASTLLLLLFSMMILGTLISALSGNFANILLTGGVLIALVIALLFNRSGLLVFEGLLIVGLWTIGIVLSFVTQPSISIGTVIQYDLLSVGILLAITFFPAWSVFFITAFNTIFILVSINRLHPTAQLAQLIAQDGIGRVVTRPISLMVVIMIITWLWARSGQHALKRADRAEMIAKLQYDLAERDQAITYQKAQLEQSIQQISQTLTSYSNGNIAARVPLTQDNVLWNIAGPINNLLNRVQRMRMAEAELNRIQPLLQRQYELEHENRLLRAALQKQNQSTPSRKAGTTNPPGPITLHGIKEKDSPSRDSW